MKWQNKGHEYDEMYKNIQSKKRFYLFGAGDYGRQFFNMFDGEIEIAGYIDNSAQKKNTKINGIMCYSFDDVVLREDEGIILTMSQIARINPIEQLKQTGYVKNKNFYLIEEFISVYFAYKYNKVYFSSISFLPSTICNLNCKNCLNFNPFAKQFYVREWDQLVKDVDLFFSCVDYIMLFHVSGGEPLLYKHTAELIDYIDKKYGHKIGTLRTVTNGTVVPKTEVLEKLSGCNVEITIDDYREAVPRFNDRFPQLLEALQKYNIKHYINKADSWIDLAPEKTDYSNETEEWLCEHRDSCNQSWEELRDGKIYSCNYAAYATVAGIAGEQNMEETYDLNKHLGELASNPGKIKELIEFRLGYTEKGYTNFCKKCRGFTPENNEEVEPAKQVPLV
ncbi:MAG: radical SAM protein [Lachnospira sp.]